MELNIVRAGSRLVPEGSIDLVSRHQLVDAGTEVLTEHGALTLDLSGVDFMDSVGIGALVQLGKAASAQGASFTVVEPSRSVRRILAVTGLADAWSSEPSAQGSGGTA